MFCSKCGNKHDHGSMFCNQCGASLAVAGAGGGSVQATARQSPSVTNAAADHNSLAMIAIIGGIFFPFLLPLLIWILKKDESPFAGDHAKETLNFQITLVIGMIGFYIALAVLGGALAFISFKLSLFVGGLGLIVVWAVGIAYLVSMVLAAIAASKGKPYQHKICFRLLK